MKIIRILSHVAGGRSFDDHLTRRQQEAQREGLVQGYLKVPIIIKAKNKKKEKSVMVRRPEQLEGRPEASGRQPSGESQRVR